jgi:lysophospholipase L1-like esterase
MPITSKSSAARPQLSWKGRIALVLFGLFLIALVLELGLRIASTLEDPRAREGWSAGNSDSKEYWAIYDPDLGYRQNPKFLDMNPEGLRDHAVAPKSDRFRVLFLGDSVAVYGDTVDDTFVGHLRAELRRDPTYSGVEVINAGIKGYTNYQEVLYLKKYGLQFRPDLVGLEFCLNDLFKFLHSFQVENDQLVAGTYEFSTEAVSQKPESLLRRMAKKSRLLVWAYNNVRIARNAAEWRARQGFSFDYRLDVRTAWQDEPWQDIERQLAGAVELGRQEGFGVFVVAFPIVVQYQADYLARDRAYVLKPQRKLKTICERLKIPFYDLYGDMEAGHFVEDGIHLTPAGRQRAGKKIATFLSGLNLLSPNKSGSKEQKLGH